jgi:proteasome accessory factor B
VFVSAAKVERLLNLSAALLAAERPLTAEEIRRRVPGYPDELASFRRAFERDKDDLREMGVPLRIRKVDADGRRHDGYVIPREEYYLRDPGLDGDELAALHLAANAIKLEGVSGIEALWKLGGTDPDDTEGVDAVADDLGDGPVARLPVDARLVELFAGLVDRHPVRFTYHDAERTVEPHRLDFQRGRWYLSGHDRTRGEARSFRVDRVAQDVEVVVEETFAPPANPHPGVTLAPWQLGGEEPVVARLRVDADQAPWATRHLGPDTVQAQEPDGSVTFDVVVHNRSAFRSFVLTFLEHAEVLEPPELRDDLLAWLGAVP